MSASYFILAFDFKTPSKVFEVSPSSPGSLAQKCNGYAMQIFGIIPEIWMTRFDTFSFTFILHILLEYYDVQLKIMHAASFRYLLGSWYCSIANVLDILQICVSFLWIFVAWCVLCVSGFPSALEVDEPWPNIIQRRMRNTFPSEQRQMESPSPVELGKRNQHSVECDEPFCCNAGFKKKNKQDFRIAHLCFWPLSWSHLQSCKSFRHISSFFIVFSQTKKSHETESLQRKTNQLTIDNAYRQRTW